MPSRLLSLQRRGIVVVSAVSMAWTRVESQYRPPSASSRPPFLAAYGNTGVDLIMECLADLGLTRCNFWRGERERVGEREREEGMARGMPLREWHVREAETTPLENPRRGT